MKKTNFRSRYTRLNTIMYLFCDLISKHTSIPSIIAIFISQAIFNTYWFKSLLRGSLDDKINWNISSWSLKCMTTSYKSSSKKDKIYTLFEKPWPPKCLSMTHKNLYGLLESSVVENLSQLNKSEEIIV